MVYKLVVPNSAATIINSMETLDEDDLEQTKEDYDQWVKKDEILQGDDVTEGDEDEAGYEDDAGDGNEDDAIDFGGDYVEVGINVLVWS